jgi:hypothetical protein
MFVKKKNYSRAQTRKKTRCISRTQLATKIILVLLDAQSTAGVHFDTFEQKNY